jgi:hypothetical protein
VFPQGGGAAIGHIWRADYDGSNVELVLENDDIFGDLFASDIAVDPIRGMVYWYNPILNQLQSATTDGTAVSADLLGTQIPLVEGLAIDYVIPEPSTWALGAGAIVPLWLVRRRSAILRQRA